MYSTIPPTVKRIAKRTGMSEYALLKIWYSVKPEIESSDEVDFLDVYIETYFRFMDEIRERGIKNKNPKEPHGNTPPPTGGL